MALVSFSPAVTSPPHSQPPLAAWQRRSAEAGVTFADIALYFSREEWCLLDDNQRGLYLGVMLENFELISSLGCSCGIDDVETVIEQSVSVRVSEEKNLKVALCPQKGHPGDSCGAVLRHIFHLIEHQEPQLGQKLLRCGSCAKQRYFSTKSPHQHKKFHKREKPFIRDVDSMSLAKDCDYNVAQKLFTREKVGLHILSESEHLQQEAAGTGERPSKTPTLGKSVERKNYVTLSERKKTVGCNHSNIQNKGVSPGQYFACRNGGKCFTLISNLGYCQRVRTGQRLYHCSECGKSYRSSTSFQYHQRIHTGERPYKCYECGKSFIRKPELHRHQRVHTGERPYTCSECGKSFNRIDYLRLHQTVHTRERPFHCSVCVKSFVTRYKLWCHQIVHTGEKPYECSECGKSYYTSTGLRYHQKLHTG